MRRFQLQTTRDKCKRHWDCKRRDVFVVRCVKSLNMLFLCLLAFSSLAPSILEGCVHLSVGTVTIEDLACVRQLQTTLSKFQHRVEGYVVCVTITFAAIGRLLCPSSIITLVLCRTGPLTAEIQKFSVVDTKFLVADLVWLVKRLLCRVFSLSDLEVPVVAIQNSSREEGKVTTVPTCKRDLEGKWSLTL